MSDQERIKNVVRDTYARIADEAPTCADATAAPASNCCGAGQRAQTVSEVAATLGYTEEELTDLPGGANMGLGCGNPHALASLAPGEVVMDLGSGGGVDCFIAAKKVGPTGRVIGIDMTPAMLTKARDTAAEHGYDNVEFRLGEIEHIPVGDNEVDAVLSNCVINLAPDKAKVFRDVFRVLKPGGRLSISDVVATAELPEEIRNDDALFSGCVSGAASIDDLERWLNDAGFEDVQIRPWQESREFIRDWAPGKNVEDFVCSAIITARKPGGCCCG